MTNQTQPLTILLENYVGKVATLYIDQVDTELQARLIALLLEVGQELRQDDQITLAVIPIAIPSYN